MPVFAFIWLIGLFVTFDNPIELIQHNWPLVVVGFIGAVIGNATAVGGGLVFVPTMILVYQLPPVTALKIAIASQCFGMTSGAIGWLRRGTIPLEALIITVPGLLIGSTISSLVIHPSTLLVKGLFGPVSILVGLLMLVTLKAHGKEKHIPHQAKIPLAMMSVIGGLITGWVAIGEGEIIAAFLMIAYGLQPERSIGLGVLLLAINSIYLCIIHNFFLGGIPWELALFTGLGCVYGGRMGAYLTQWVSPHYLKIGFSIIAIVDGTIFLLQFLLN